MRYLIMASLLIAALVLSPVNISAQACDSVSIQVTAEIATDPGYEGLYKYTFSGYWQAAEPGAGVNVSYFLFSLGAECPCLCDSSYSEIYFPKTAGTSSGIHDPGGQPCEAKFVGSLLCEGKQGVTTDNVVNFEAQIRDCEPGASGTGEWIFYSTMAPLPWAEYPNAIIIKHGGTHCTGDLSGQLPDCFECSEVSTEEGSWGSIKTIYR